MEKRKKLNILVTNDDGIDSPGIYALTNELKGIGNVIVVAPDRQQSAVGHALTVSKPLRVTKFHRDGEMFGYAINGTPTDCVKLAVNTLLDEKPDIIVSGINHGKNTSINILYSGTVSASTEGILLGIPSMAISLDSYNLQEDCSAAAEWAVTIAKELMEIKLPKGTLINVNVPSIEKDKIKGVLITRHSDGFWKDSYEKRVDPFGREYFWFSGEYQVNDKGLDTDDGALISGYVSVTPIRFEFTDTKSMKLLKILEKLNL